MTLTEDIKILAEKVNALELSVQILTSKLEAMQPKPRVFEKEVITHPNRTINYDQMEPIIQGNKV